MPTEGLCLRVTYSGQGNQILIVDIHDGVDARNAREVSRKPGPLYISQGQSVDLIFTSSVAYSFESGIIRSYIEEGRFTATFVVGTTLGTALDGAVSGLITGDHQALTNPTTPTELADFLDSNYQPTFPTETSSYTIYVRTTGDDDANGGTSDADAFATVQRALQRVATLNNGTSIATIDIGAGTFNFPRLITANYTTFQGTTSVEDTLTIDTVQVADNDDGIVIDVTSTGGPYSADELEGRKLLWTSGTSNNNPGWSYRNDATVGGVTRIYATHDSGITTGIESMSNSDTIDLISLDTTLNMVGATILINSVQMNMRDLNFIATSNTTLQALSTDKVDFTGCFFDGDSSFLRILRAGGMGRMYLTTCYIATSGTASAAMLQCQNNGFIQIHRGSVIDADLNGVADPDARMVQGSAGSLIGFQGHVVCRGFDEGKIFQVDGLGIFGIGGITSADNILVEDANGTSTYQVGPVFEINSTGEGQGGWYQVPRLHGAITEDYSVVAQNGGTVRVGDSPGTSTITTNLGTNTVSADGGTSNVAQSADLVIIENGSPAFSGFATRYTESFVNADLSGGVLTVTHNLGQQFVNVAVYDNNDDRVDPDAVTATSATACDVDLSSQGALTGTWNVVVSG